MKITAVETKGNFYQLHFDEGFEALTVNEDLLITHRLLKGKEISLGTYQELAKLKDYQRGMEVSYRYLAHRLRSEKEVWEKLKLQEIPAAAARQVIIRLKELRLIDDTMFSDSFVKTMVREGKKGPGDIMRKLRKKGITEETAARSLGEFYPAEQETENAAAAAEKIWQKNSRRSEREARQKVIQGLRQAGFSAEQIESALETADFSRSEDGEAENLKQAIAKNWRKYARLSEKDGKQKMLQYLARKGFQFDESRKMLDEWLEEERHVEDE